MQRPLPQVSPLDGVSTPPDPIVLPPDLTLQYTLKGHTSSVYGVEWSPDGMQLASCSSDGTVRLWDMIIGKELHRLENHTDRICEVAWSPNGKYLASCSLDQTVWVWDATTGKALHKLEGHTSVVLEVKWSPDGMRLASGSTDRTVQVWDAATGKALCRLEGHASQMYDLGWSPDGQRLALCSTNKTVQVWDVIMGKALHKLEGHTDVVHKVVWSPDGKWLASGSDDRTVRVWSATTGKELHRLEGHTSVVHEVEWSPDGKWLASCSDDRTVRVWEVTTGKELHRLEGHTSVVHEVEWSPDGKWLASCSSNTAESETEVRIWRTDTWESFTMINGLYSRYPLVTWHPHLPLMVTAGQRTQDLLVWQLDLEHHLHGVSAPETVHYRSAKVVLVGDSGVGKSGLALVLTSQPFTPTDSTHGRHVWLLDQQEVPFDGRLHETREAWLWDLAGQRDYRLIHQLHLHEATVALIVFDPTRNTDSFAGVRHWHRALRLAQQTGRSGTMPLSIFLVAARMDRGGRSVSRVRIDELVRELGCAGYVETSAKNGRGIVELGQIIRTALDWTALPTITSTKLLHAIKTFVRHEQGKGRPLYTVGELYQAFLHTSDTLVPSDELQQQFEAVLSRLGALGDIHWLGFGNLILLQPERLDAYASALVIAAKDEPDGLGCIAEVRVQQGQFVIPPEASLGNRVQEQLLLIAMIDELVRHELVLREGGALIFPSQSTCEHPEHAVLTEKQTVMFTFDGPVLSIYTTLVVRLAQCGIFQKQGLWQHIVTYTTRLGGTYGLLLSPRGEEGAELGIFFDESAHEEMRFHFEGFVHTHLKRHAGETVQRRRHFVCPTCGDAFTETQVSNRRKRNFNFIRCSTCDTSVSLLDGTERLSASPPPLVMKMEQEADVQRDRKSAASKLDGKKATQDFDVFLCHNGQDKLAVTQIGEQLKLHGILPWLDEWELRPGLPWQRVLEEQLSQIKTAAVFVGKNGLGPWQQNELDAFLREFVRRGCPVIPVLLKDAPQEPALPMFLNAMTWVDFRVATPDPMQRLLWGISGKRDLSTRM